MQVFSVRVKV